MLRKNKGPKIARTKTTPPNNWHPATTPPHRLQHQERQLHPHPTIQQISNTIRQNEHSRINQIKIHIHLNTHMPPPPPRFTPSYGSGGMRGAFKYPPPLALPGLGVSNNNSKCQMSFIKSHDVTCPPLFLPPGGPAHSAGPTPNLRKLCFWDILGRLFSILGRLFSIFGRFFCALKIIKKTSSKKHAPKPQKSGPWSPKCRFWHRFWDPFGIIFSLNFRLRHNMRQPPECLYT